MADFAPPADAHPALLSTQRHLLLNQVIEHRAKIAALGRQQVQKEAEQATIAATVHKLETMFPVIQPGVDIRKTLMEKKLGSKLTYFETLQLLGRATRRTQRSEEPSARGGGGRGRDSRDPRPGGRRKSAHTTNSPRPSKRRTGSPRT
jgi:hemolysin D